MNPIDLRSDTVTRPTDAMKQAMLAAEVGDDVYGEDPSVNELEDLAAEMLGTEAALFCSSGTQSNLLALMSHCGRGDEYIVGQQAHTYWYEGGGAAVLGSIQPQPLDFEPDGTLDLQKTGRFIKPDDYHFAKTRLLCLENTHAGQVLPMSYLGNARKFADTHGLNLHLDGARVFNAAVSLKVNVKEITRHFDTVSCCLSKGLGAPVGSVLCGAEEKIKIARRWRKVLGGGMRQAGFIAAAGKYALLNHVRRLEKDHANARKLASGLAGISSSRLRVEQARTNMVFADIKADIDLLTDFLKKKGILIGRSTHLRMVTHLDIAEQDIDDTVQAFGEFFAH